MSAPPLPLLPTRPLGRSGIEIPIVVWELSAGARASSEVLNQIAPTQATWLIVPAELTNSESTALRETLSSVKAEWSLVLSLPAEAIRPRTSRLVEDCLSRLGQGGFAGLWLHDLTPNDAKAGWPFHRVSQLRQRQQVNWSFVECPDTAIAEWMVEHSPAHAITVPFSLADQSAKYRILPAAAELGTAILTRPDAHTPEELRFLASEEQLTAMVLPLPPSIDATHSIAQALVHPLPPQERSDLWADYQRRVPPPPKPRSGHPPDVGG